MLPTLMRLNKWSSLIRQTRKSRNPPNCSATSRRVEVYPYTGQRLILYVTNPICESWKEKSGFVTSLWSFILVPHILQPVGRNEEAPC